MFIFTADNFSGDLAEDCNEGNLKWIPKDEVMDLPVWEGDKIFLKLLIDDAPFFLLKLVYEGEKLVKYTLN